MKLNKFNAVPFADKTVNGDRRGEWYVLYCGQAYFTCITHESDRKVDLVIDRQLADERLKQSFHNVVIAVVERMNAEYINEMFISSIDDSYFKPAKEFLEEFGYLTHVAGDVERE